MVRKSLGRGRACSKPVQPLSALSPAWVQAAQVNSQGDSGGLHQPSRPLSQVTSVNCSCQFDQLKMKLILWVTVIWAVGWNALGSEAVGSQAHSWSLRMVTWPPGILSVRLLVESSVAQQVTGRSTHVCIFRSIRGGFIWRKGTVFLFKYWNLEPGTNVTCTHYIWNGHKTNRR